MVDVEEKNAVDKLLQAEENANNIIKEAQRERQDYFIIFKNFYNIKKRKKIKRSKNVS